MKAKQIKRVIVGTSILLLAIIGIILFFVFRGTPATGIILYNDTIELTAGETKKLDYEIQPNSAANKSVEWQSSNPSIARVNDTGEVIAVSEGEAVIMVTTVNGKIDECLISVKSTAFDYLKKLSDSKEGYTVGNYSPSAGSTVSIGIVYNRAEDSIYLMNSSTGISNGHRYSGLSSIVIPSSLDGMYQGCLEFDYGFNMNYGGSRIVHTTYLVDAGVLTSATQLRSKECDGASYQVSENEEIYTSTVHAMLAQVHEQLLAPNGYSYSDLGFDLYS